MPEPRPQPLDGVRVVDVSSFLAGPFCSTQLAEFGAEVIKLELPIVGDPLRKFGSVTECGETLPWLSECRNKKSATLDLRKPDGAALLKRMVAEADILVENFQPGTLEKWGLGWDVMQEVNPRLIMVRISGFGQTGPYKGRPGFGRIGNAFGGLSFLAGYPDRPPVTPGSATIPDYLAGLYGAFGALLAMQAREKTGKGQVVDIGLYEPIFRILDELAPSFQLNGYIRQRMGPGTVNVVPHSHYPTKDGRWIAIACTSDKIFSRLAGAMGVPEWGGEGKWGTVRRREAEREIVDEYVGKWTAQHTRDELQAVCEANEVPFGPVYSIDEIFQDPQYAARENILTVKDDRVGELAIPNVVPRLTDTPGGVKWLGPSMGEHNDEVYRGWMKLDQAEIDRLKGLQVI
ncbi:CoA transferase [Roseococcus sp. SYP-B2431]|uniref:CaiB/BaiF CoA transferase family protein n=1 Tax=Roseococcus sp. SYP-B2431 TaxID=2496640 RepID=UPI00103DF69C|nr:CoA transferase [Roseococcus sp. SYP-B2431]TCH96015.1 CoA transferase [Roseococcus sp. SYP-B2431]